MLDAESCWRALRARDSRFDGRFFVGVSTTGIYCRSICPARTPGRDRCSFHASAAAAEKAGFRACFRCRPELAPGTANVDAVSRLVARALPRIGAGYLDEASVDDLGRELGVSGRQLRRAMASELGVSPIELAQTRRLGLAKQLLRDSDLSLTAIAFASGFRSLRRFNTSVRDRFGLSPGELRRKRVGLRSTGGKISLRLDFRPPLDFSHVLQFVSARAIPGVERVEGDVYARILRVGESTGELRVFCSREGSSARLELDGSLAPIIPQVVAGVRRLFDLDAEPRAIAVALRRDPLLAPLVRRRPGLRVPGAFDPFETAIRAILGQQVSVAGATTLAGRLVSHFEGTPTPARLGRTTAATLANLGLPHGRARALIGLARGWNRDFTCEPGADPDAMVRGLVEVPGIGPWTAQYLCMRVLQFPDGFPASDLGLRKALGGCSAREVGERANSWRPWRAYAAMHLWTALAHGELP